MELSLKLKRPDARVQLFGAADANLRVMRETCNVAVTARDGQVRLAGTKQAVAKAANLFRLMQERLERTECITKADMRDMVLDAARMEANEERRQIHVYMRGRVIAARTTGQQEYVDAIERNVLTFCTGPAGTGKTYLAVAMAVAMLKRNSIRRIVLARPAVEAGEKLGFLPGDMQEKVNPYLRPLFDALGDMMEYSQVKRFLFNDVIEVIPLAFMRGRTFNDAVVILDEAQNTTSSQMLMFLTRLGHDSKMIVTGDDSQSDLENDQVSGLVDATRRLKGIKGIAFVRLAHGDIVRHRLVQNIVQAYGNGPSNPDE